MYTRGSCPCTEVGLEGARTQLDKSLPITPDDLDEDAVLGIWRLERNLASMLAHTTWMPTLSDVQPARATLARATQIRSQYFSRVLGPTIRPLCSDEGSRPVWLRRGLAQARLRQLGTVNTFGEPLSQLIRDAVAYGNGVPPELYIQILERVPEAWPILEDRLNDLPVNGRRRRSVANRSRLSVTLVKALQQSGITGLHEVAKNLVDEQRLHFLTGSSNRKVAGCLGFGNGKSCIFLPDENSPGEFLLRLAHEMGHAYHYRVLADQSDSNAESSHPMAEFSAMTIESIIFESLYAQFEELRSDLLEAKLERAAVILCDGYVRSIAEQAGYDMLDPAAKNRRSPVDVTFNLISQMPDTLKRRMEGRLPWVGEEGYRKAPCGDLNYIIGYLLRSTYNIVESLDKYRAILVDSGGSDLLMLSRRSGYFPDVDELFESALTQGNLP